MDRQKQLETGLVLVLGLTVLPGQISGKVPLTLVDVVVLLPLSPAARWTGRLGIRRRPEGNSYFADVNHTYDKEDLKNPW